MVLPLSKDSLNNNRILLVVLAGLGIQLLALPIVNGVDSDVGYYLYDAILAMEGGVPMVDYPSRSPLFHYLLAGGLSFGFDPLLTGRAFAVSVSVLTGVLLTVFFGRLIDERVRLGVALLYFITPMTVLYGIRLDKSTQFASSIFILLGLVVWVTRIDVEQDTRGFSVFLGVCLGASFLIRRVVIAHGLAIAIFILYYRIVVQDRSYFVSTKEVATIGISALGTISTAYIALGWPSVRDIYLLFHVHLLSLIFSRGRSAISWVAEGPVAMVGSTGTISVSNSLIHTICPGCRAGLAIVLLRGMAVMLPVVLVLLVFAFSFADRKGLDRKIVLQLLCAVHVIWFGGWFIALSRMKTLPTGYFGAMMLAIGVMSVFASIFYFASEQPTFRSLWSPKMLLPMFIALVPFVMYLARDRSFFLSYLLDVYPYLVGIAGVGFTGMVSRLESNHLRAIAVTLLTLSIILGFTFGPNFIPTQQRINPTFGDPVTYPEVRDVGEDLRQRTNVHDEVFTAQMLFVIAANRTAAADLSRGHYIFSPRFQAASHEIIERRLVDKLSGAGIEYVILEEDSRRLLNNSPRVSSIIQNSYCPVVDDDVYERANADLLRRSKGAPECNNNSSTV